VREQRHRAFVLLGMYSFIATTFSTPGTHRLQLIHNSDYLHSNPSAHLPNFLISSILNGGYTSAAHANPT
jgi:hypothetical protein